MACPAPSPLQSLIHSTAPTNTTPSSDDDSIVTLYALATQIKHNLHHQHAWTNLHIHTHSPLTSLPLPRPLLSGLPPQRLYIHPDEQIELLKAADRARKGKAKAVQDDAASTTASTSVKGEGEKVAEGKEATAEGLDVKPAPEREWILPTRLSEKWTLRRLAEVFDAVSLVPPSFSSSDGKDENGEAKEETEEEEKPNPWRTTKRVVLASADTDSTVVYYIVQDGLVKPRQN